MTHGGSHYTDDPDTRLMMAFASGDDAAFDAIVNRFERQVYGVIQRYLGNSGHSSQAEDCAQEVFIRLYRMRKSYKPTARLSTLVYRIASNLCINVLRDETRRRGVALDAPCALDGSPLGATIADSAAVSAEEAFSARERAEIVRKALAAIPDRQRAALILHRFEGLSYNDIADALETNVDAVKSLLSRARASFADALKRDLDAGNI